MSSTRSFLTEDIVFLWWKSWMYVNILVIYSGARLFRLLYTIVTVLYCISPTVSPIVNCYCWVICIHLAFKRDANTRESLGEFESLCEPKPQARVYVSTFKFNKTLSSGCIRLYKHRASIFYFFYKIWLGNMLWRHNHVCIAWYKRGNWPITAFVRHNLFYKYI